MFTGIIEEVGTVKGFAINGSSGRIKIKARKVLEGTELGDSISVNGVCLTVVTMQPGSFEADVTRETVDRSGLAELNVGDAVNLERAMLMGGRFGGHIVSGHIDGTGTVVSKKKVENSTVITIGADKKIINGIVPKGSVAIDGISLTVAELTDKTFSVAVIPHTGEETTLVLKGEGSTVNLENDVIGKYVERFMGIYTGKEISEISSPVKSGLTLDKLIENGF
ncbi:MAG: riboflavin synthase [Lachnospiraceae bacterium]|nr:riboflavin synthase [Lachnospiraceae bacterium]